MQNKLLSCVRRHNLFHRGDTVLVAVSGGADSVALLCALHELAPSLGISTVAGHINHLIRGKASDADAGFVKKLAARLKVPFAGGEADVPRLAKSRGLSMEMAAREARYAFLVKTARRVKATVIATAHTADDQVETILLKLARGAGPRGLAGISRESSIGGIRVVRPMLDVRRSDVEAFLKERKQAWREDSTNRDLSYLRNSVRHEVLPFLAKKLNPDIRTALLRTADILREEDAWLEELSAGILKKCVTKGKATLLLKGLTAAGAAARRRVLRQWLSGAGIQPELVDYDVIARVEAMINAERGTGQTEVAANWIVKKRYDRLTAEKGKTVATKEFVAVVSIPGRILLKTLELEIVTAIKPGLIKDRLAGIGRIPAKASINLSALAGRKLIVRSWKKGDRIRPFGMMGSKKLQDILIDEKVPLEERGRLPVFECDGELVWIPGYRVARGWEVSDPADPALQIQVCEQAKI